MSRPLSETAIWLDEREEVTLEELAACSGCTMAELEELIEHDILPPHHGEPMLFSARAVVVARVATRLRHELELEPHALALVVSLMERIEQLEHQLRHVNATLPRRRNL